MKKLIKLVISIVLSMCIVTAFTQAQDNSATLVDGKTFNSKIKTLAVGNGKSYDDWDNKITAIKKSTKAPGANIKTDNISHTENIPVQIWYDNGVIYYYSEVKKLYLNSDSSKMFKGLTELKDISGLTNFDASKVTDMESMFTSCYNLINVSALKNWNTSNVTNMKNLFTASQNLTDISGISNWNTSNVTNMESMFHNCKSLKNITALSNWDVKNVTDMSNMFYDCDLNNISSLKNWDVKNVTDMNGIFARSTDLTDISALKYWDVSNVTNMGSMFYSCSSLKDISPLKDWKVNKVKKMGSIFAYCANLENISVLSNWNTENLMDMVEMFRGCNKLKDASALSNWNTSNATSMDFLFEGCKNLTLIDLGNRDTSNVTSMFQMFKNCDKLKTIYVGEGFVTDKVKAKSYDIWDPATQLFDGDVKLVGGNGTKYNSSHTDKSYARIDTPETPGYFTKKGSTPFEIPQNREFSEGNPSDILGNGYTREMNNAYNFAYANGLTTANSIDKAKMNSPLTRIAMAKILSNYAINILGKQPDYSKGSIEFNDVTVKQNSDYNNAVTLAYQLGIMGQNIKNNNFRPNDIVTRAEFATALSRMLYSTPDGKPYYKTHLMKLKDAGIITNDNPNIKEKRGYIMLMLMRTIL